MATVDIRGANLSSTDPPISTTPNPDLAIKAPVVAATTGSNITLSGIQAIDGVTVGNNAERVLVKDQTDQTTNGIYNAATGPWTRTIDAENNSQFANGTTVYVAQGTLNGNSGYMITTPNPIVLGTSNITWNTASNITLAKMAALAANSVIGNNTGSPATPIALSESQFTAMLNVFTSALQGVVPASGGGTTNFLRADASWAAPPAPSTWTNTRLAKTANYTVANADKGSTIALGGSAFFTLTFAAASGYDANFQAVVINEDTGRCKTVILTGGATFTLWPGQTAFVYAQNNVWQFLKNNRWQLTATTNIYVDTTSGSDSGTNDGMTSGSAFLTVQHAYDVVQSQIDLDAQTINCNLVQALTTLTGSIELIGPLVGQTTPAQFNILGAGPSSTIVTTSTAGAYLFYAVDGASFQVSGIQLKNTSGSGGCLLVSHGDIWFNNVWFNAQANSALDTNGPQSSIAYNGGNWTILSTTSVNIFAVAEDHSIIYLGGSPGLSISGAPNVGTTGFVQSDLGGMIEATGFTIALAGSPTGVRYHLGGSMGIIFTSGGGANFFPGNSAGTGTSSSIGVYA
jgi:hypothetical protein